MLQMLHRKPWVGLLGLAVGFLTQPLGQAADRMLDVVSGEAVYRAASATGNLGLSVILNGSAMSHPPRIVNDQTLTLSPPM